MDTIYIDKLESNHNKGEIISQLIRNSELNLEFIYESKFTNTKDLRDFIGIIGKQIGLDEKMIARLILISDELNNNAIEYGSISSSYNSMRVKIKVNDDNTEDFIMEVEDSGNGKAPKTALDMETMRAHKLKRGYGKYDSIRGRGLFLITVQIADRLYFKNSKKGGLIVGIKKKIKK